MLRFQEQKLSQGFQFSSVNINKEDIMVLEKELHFVNLFPISQMNQFLFG